MRVTDFVQRVSPVPGGLGAAALGIRVQIPLRLVQPRLAWGAA